MSYSGSCLCKAVTFEVHGDFDRFFLCHCSRCRKITGSAHASNLFSKAARIAWLSGQDRIRTYSLPGSRFGKSFCDTCGGALPRVDETRILVPAGCLDSPVATAPTAHIFTASRADWDKDLEKAPGFDELPA